MRQPPRRRGAKLPVDTPFLRALHNDLVEYERGVHAEMDKVRDLLDVLEGKAQVVRETLDVLEGREGETEQEAPADQQPAQPEPEPDEQQDDDLEPTRVAMCGACGAGTWTYSEGSKCPVCGEDQPTFPPHLQPEGVQSQVVARAPGGRVTQEQVRNVVIRTRAPFTRRDLHEWLGTTKDKQIMPHIESLIKQGIVRDETGFERKVFTYDHARTGGPTKRAREDNVVPMRRGRGEPVQGTGRPMGRTGRPGRDKKLAASGKRVVDKKKR